MNSLMSPPKKILVKFLYILRLFSAGYPELAVAFWQKLLKSNADFSKTKEFENMAMGKNGTYLIKIVEK